jgi:hypothetical protein
MLIMSTRIDVILPSLNEAEAPPTVIGAAAVSAGRADLAVGSRVPTGRSVRPWYARAGGRSKVPGSVRGTLLAARDMAKVAYR